MSGWYVQPFTRWFAEYGKSGSCWIALVAQRDGRRRRRIITIVGSSALHQAGVDEEAAPVERIDFGDRGLALAAWRRPLSRDAALRLLRLARSARRDHG